MSLRSAYAKQVRQTFGPGYHAAWFPDTSHKIGTYGRMVDDVFMPCGNLQELGVTYTTDIDTIPSALNITSSKGVAITTKLQGETNQNLPNIPQASAGIGIEFKSEGSFILAAEEVYEDRIANPGQLEAQLIALKKNNQWDSDFRIITGILRMPVATILISQSKNTKLELSIEGSLTAAINELGKAGVSANFLYESSTVLKYAPARNAVPIIQLHQLVSRFPFLPPRLRTFSANAVDAPGAQLEWGLAIDDSLSKETEAPLE
jgi:hypothetical protein